MNITLKKARSAVSRTARSQARSTAPAARRRGNGEAGQALLEFAYIMPVLLVVVFGLIVFGLALNNYLAVTEATSTGARYLSTLRGQTTDPCVDTVNTVVAAAPNLTATSFTFKLVLNGTTYGPGSNALSCQGGKNNLVQSGPAQVVVTYPCNLKVMGINFAPGCTLTAQTTERVQ